MIKDSWGNGVQGAGSGGLWSIPPRITLGPPAADVALYAAATVLPWPGFQRFVGEIRAEPMLWPHRDRKDRRGAHWRAGVNPPLPLFGGERSGGRGAMKQVVGVLGFNDEQSHGCGMQGNGVQGLPTTWRAPCGPVVAVMGE